MRKMKVLRHPDNHEERVCVGADETEGYPGWVEVEEREGLPPEHADFKDGKHVVDPARKRKAEQDARFTAMTRAELVAFFMEEIGKLQDQINKMKRS